MAEQRIPDLSSIDAVALTDVIHVVDTSDATSTVDGTSKRATISQVRTALSIPATTSDLAEGTNLYFTDARVANTSAVQANTAKVSNATHTGDVTGATTLTIADDVVTNAKLANVATNTIKGRVTASTGDLEDLSATQVRTLINVEDGATADQTAGEIKTAYESNTNTNAFTDAEKTKLGTVETNADVTDTANVTAAGALMDSEVTNLAQVKAFDSSDYATAAQGGLADTAVQPAEIADFETTTQLNARDTANRNRANHTGTQTASTISDFDTAVAANSAVTANTAKVTNATHTGDVTGATALTIANGAVTLAKMANLAQDQFIGRTTASTGVPQTATITAAARTVLDDTSIANMVNTLGGATSTGTGGLVRAGSPALITPSIAAITVSGGVMTLPTGSSDTLATVTQVNAKAPTASPTLTGTTTVDRLNYDQGVGTVSALGNLGATETIDWATATHFTGNLDSNITFTNSNSVSGQSITLYLTYSGAQRTITWPTTTWLDNATGAAPTAPATTGDVLVVTLQNIGGTIYGSATGNFAVYA